MGSRYAGIALVCCLFAFLASTFPKVPIPCDVDGVNCEYDTLSEALAAHNFDLFYDRLGDTFKRKVAREDAPNLWYLPFLNGRHIFLHHHRYGPTHDTIFCFQATDVFDSPRMYMVFKKDISGSWRLDGITKVDMNNDNGTALVHYIIDVPKEHFEKWLEVAWRKLCRICIKTKD